MTTREIKYDRTTRDYLMLLDNEPVGYARSYHEAETTLDALVIELIQARPAEVAELVYSADPALVAQERDEDGEPRICDECGSAGTPGALLIDPSDEDGALAWYCQECQNDWQAVAAFEASLSNDGSPELNPDYLAFVSEPPCADPTNGGAPTPNDAPIPLPEEVPGNPSDGRASPLQRWRDQGAAEQARIAAKRGF